MSKYEKLIEAVVNGEQDAVKEEINRSLARGDSPLEIISGGLTYGMAIVGQRMKSGEMFIPEVLGSAQAMREGMEVLKPIITSSDMSFLYTGTVVMGTVQGDVHDLGKNIVCTILESGGFKVVDIGIDVPTEKFIEAIIREKPDILGMSALLTTTMPRMGEVIEALKKNNLRDRVRVMVGGAPITQAFADSIGADAYGQNAIYALDKAKQLMGKT